jgi:hypothetical protein
MFNRELTKQQEEVPDYPERIKSTVKNEYELVSVWIEDDLNNESGFFNFLQRVDR